MVRNLLVEISLNYFFYKDIGRNFFGCFVWGFLWSVSVTEWI